MKTNLINLDRRGYGNVGVYSSDDEFMFYTNQRKLNFYIKNNLIEKVSDTHYKLTFEPKGKGYSDKDSAIGKFCNIPRINQCVVTGETDLTKITKHHIVPSCFRKHFPIEKKNNFQLVVQILNKEHTRYTEIEQQFYNEIADMFGVPHWATYSKPIPDIIGGSKIAKTLFLHRDKMPQDRREALELRFVQHTGLKPTLTNLQESINFDLVDSQIPKVKEKKTVDNNFGAAVAAKITDYRAFEKMWLDHFILHMQPKFMPEDLMLNYYGETVS